MGLDSALSLHLDHDFRMSPNLGEGVLMMGGRADGKATGPMT